jgi:hypothetical protein
MQLFLTITLCLIIGAATAYFANQRKRDPLIWFMIGMLLGLLGLLLLFLLPPGKEEGSKETVELEEIPPQSSIEHHPRPITHDYLVKDWFYYDRSRQRHGPIRFDKLKELWKKGEINEESFIWAEGMTEWLKLEEVHGLYTNLQLGT